MQNKTRKREVAGQNLQPGFDKPRQSEALKKAHDEKIEVEIREVIRIKPADFAALMESFEEWAKQWE